MNGDHARQEDGPLSTSSICREVESDSWAVRAAAGRRLAGMTDQEEIRPLLLQLMMDPRDTGVTQETAEALLERKDLLGLCLVLMALSRAEAWWTIDQLSGEVYGYQDMMIADDRAAQFTEQLVTLTTDEDAGVQEEALRMLGE
ncbi:hypothetical protein ACIP9H_11295 [Streptomyces sp. NPDC088732]|uniref:hypothetical protein n=1 Tax=Streptomyces sp. NPDC088732 TaxID=3365879 RepID=UPI0038210520